MLASGGLYAAADGSGITFTQAGLASLGIADAAAPTAEQLAAEGLAQVVVSGAKSAAAGLLSLAGVAALKLLGGVAGNALIQLLTSSTPANAGEDRLLAFENDYSDLPVAPPLPGSVVQGQNGSVTIDLPYNLAFLRWASIRLMIRKLCQTTV